MGGGDLFAALKGAGALKKVAEANVGGGEEQKKRLEEQRQALQPWKTLSAAKNAEKDMQQRLWSGTPCKAYEIFKEDENWESQLDCSVQLEKGGKEVGQCNLTDFCKFCSGKTIKLTALGSAKEITVRDADIYKLRSIEPLEDVDDVVIDTKECRIVLKEPTKLDEVEKAAQKADERKKITERVEALGSEDWE